MNHWLIAEWRDVLKHAWSIRFIILAGIFTALAVTIALLDGILPVSPIWFAVLAGVFNMAAVIARLFAQKRIMQARKNADNT